MKFIYLIRSSIVACSFCPILFSCQNSAEFSAKPRLRQVASSDSEGIGSMQRSSSDEPPILIQESEKPEENLSENVDAPVPSHKIWTKTTESFNANLTDTVAIRLAPENKLSEQDILMSWTTIPKTEGHSQEKATYYEDSAIQGTPAAYALDSFQQVNQRLLDILVVIDNSSSMFEEQLNLGDKLAPLLQYVSTSDWRIAVTTTDPSQECVAAIIDSHDSEPQRKFRAAIAQGTNGSPSERGILSAVNALKGGCLTHPWIRDGSHLAILFVSDEDNCSDGTECPGQPYALGSYLFDYLASIRIPNSTGRIHGLFWHPSQSQFQCITGTNKASIYASLVAQTGGSWGSICDFDYTETLQGISKNIQLSLERNFVLSSTPIENSVTAYINEKESTEDLAINGSTITFTQPPPPGSKIKFRYLVSPGSIRADFRLSHSADSSRLVTFIDNVQQPSNSYSYDPRSQTVTFLDPPPASSYIQFKYFDNVTLKTSFFLSEGDIVENSIKVTTRGSETPPFKFLPISREVIFQSAPPEGDDITFSYQTRGAMKLSYPINALAHAGTIEAYDRQSAEMLSTHVSNGYIVFEAGDFRENRSITVRMTLEEHSNSLRLDHTPIDKTIEVSTAGGSCLSFVLSFNTLDLSKCDFAAKDEISISYLTITGTNTHFSFSKPLPQGDNFQQWRVFVNDIEVSFQRKLNNITLTQPPPIDSNVRIELSKIAE